MSKNRILYVRDKYQKVFKNRRSDDSRAYLFLYRFSKDFYALM